MDSATDWGFDGDGVEQDDSDMLLPQDSAEMDFLREFAQPEVQEKLPSPAPPPRRANPSTIHGLTADQARVAALNIRNFGTMSGTLPNTGKRKRPRPSAPAATELGMERRQRRRESSSASPIRSDVSEDRDTDDEGRYYTAGAVRKDGVRNQTATTAFPMGDVFSGEFGNGGGNYVDMMREVQLAASTAYLPPCPLCDLRLVGEASGSDAPWLDSFVRMLHTYYYKHRLSMLPMRIYVNITRMWDMTMNIPHRGQRGSFLDELRRTGALAPTLSLEQCREHFQHCVWDPRNMLLQNMDRLASVINVLDNQVVRRHEHGGSVAESNTSAPTDGNDGETVNLVLLEQQRRLVRDVNDMLKTLIAMRTTSTGEHYLSRGSGASAIASVSADAHGRSGSGRSGGRVSSQTAVRAMASTKTT